ncbi:hypothetical protein [Caballeronia pedi]|uniref:hypothetical protein n=1 Tax=Caballeronia pedi TaxID=1777141 RepID=UPI001FC9A34E|nr:hypothetical protein [Caballeronia pedi]
MLDLDKTGQRSDQAVAELVRARRAHTIGERKNSCIVSRIHMNAHCPENDAGIALKEQGAGLPSERREATAREHVSAMMHCVIDDLSSRERTGMWALTRRST